MKNALPLEPFSGTWYEESGKEKRKCFLLAQKSYVWIWAWLENLECLGIVSSIHPNASLASWEK